MSTEYRPRGGRSSRGRGGPIRGSGFRGRGSYLDRDGGRGSFRSRGGFSRGRGGPPRSRDELSPPRTYESTDRGRGPPPSRRHDRYEDSFDTRPSMRVKDLYSSPPRESGRTFDRHSPPPRRERDYPPRHSDNPSSSRGDYLPPRSYSPPRDTGYGSSSYKDSYSSGPREERRTMRDYPPRSSDYDRRDFRDTPRDYSSRDYPSTRNGEFRDPMSSRDFRDAPRSDRYSGGGSGSSTRGSRGRSRFDDRGPPREYSGRGRGVRDDRGRGFMNGSRGSRGSPRGRGRDFGGSRVDRRSPSPERAGGKRPRLDSGDYRR